MKKWLIVVIIVVSVIFVFFAVDLVGILAFKRPVFAKKSSRDYVYEGLLYDTYNCPEMSMPIIKAKNKQETCQVNDSNDDKNSNGTTTEINTKVKSIVDTTRDIEGFTCASAMERFYEDDKNYYSFSCIKSSYILVIYEDDSQEKLTDALSHNKIKIQDLDTYGINYSKEQKTKKSNYSIKSIEDTSKSIDGFVCAQVIEQFYEDDSYIYSFSCAKSSYIVVNYQGGYKESLREALESGRISIKDLDTYKISYSKDKK